MRIFKHILRICPILISAGLSLYPCAALSQETGQGISIDTFRPSSSVNSIFELSLPRTKEHLKWSAGALFSYAQAPVRRHLSDEEIDVIPFKVGADLQAAIGLFGFLETGLVIPIIVYQAGDEKADPYAQGELQHAGLGDPRLEIKARIATLSNFTLGLGVLASAPLGHYLSSGEDFMGPTGPTLEPKVMSSFDFKPFVFGLNVGFLLRPEATLGSSAPGGIPIPEDEKYHQTHAVTWNAGAAVDLVDFDEPGGLRAGLEVNGAAGMDFDSLSETPMEYLGGLKYRLANDLILSLGAGSSLSTAPGNPAFRIVAGVSYDSVLRNCPAGPEDMDGFEDSDKCIDPDNDEDSVYDADDPCPNEAEDKDSFEDDDGCPDVDNDKDLISDELDKCPLIPEDADNFEDHDGCPEEGPGKPTVRVTDSQLLISSKIYFDSNKSNIKEVSFPILDAVAEALRDNPQLSKIRVEGHTDNEGTAEYNLQLSRQRAKAVVDYLIGKKVSADRLLSEGYGFTRPKASNTMDEGRAINRRVEFTILNKE